MYQEMKMEIGDLVYVYDEHWIIIQVDHSTVPELLTGLSSDWSRCVFTIDDIDQGGCNEIV
jgi:hypothetical protein